MIRQHVMRAEWYWLCRIIIKLDRIPRYGRVITLERVMDSGMNWRILKHKRVWCYERHGRWGMNLLKDWGMYWPFLEESHFRAELKRQRKPVDARQRRRELWLIVFLFSLAVLSVLVLVLSLIASSSGT